MAGTRADQTGSLFGMDETVFNGDGRPFLDKARHQGIAGRGEYRIQTAAAAAGPGAASPAHRHGRGRAAPLAPRFRRNLPGRPRP